MSNTDSLYDMAARYGVQFDGTLVGHEYHEQVSNEFLTLAEVAKGGGKISRVRILAEQGYCDISYIHATMPGGKIVHVCDLPGSSRTNRLMADFIQWGKDSKVYAKGVNLLNRDCWSILYG